MVFVLAIPDQTEALLKTNLAGGFSKVSSHPARRPRGQAFSRGDRWSVTVVISRRVRRENFSTKAASSGSTPRPSWRSVSRRARSTDRASVLMAASGDAIDALMRFGFGSSNALLREQLASLWVVGLTDVKFKSGRDAFHRVATGRVPPVLTSPQRILKPTRTTESPKAFVFLWPLFASCSPQGIVDEWIVLPNR